MSDLTIQKVLRSHSHPTRKKTARVSGGFGDAVKGALSRLNQLDAESSKAVEQLVEGQAGIHETMITMQKADISFRMFLQIRNKAMEAYREIMRMPM